MTSLTWASIIPTLPELFLAVAGMVLLVAGAFMGNQRTKLFCQLAMGIFLISGWFLLGLDWDRTVTLNGFFVLDRFAGFLKLLILVGMTAVVALSLRYLYQEQIARFEYPVLLIFAALGMMIMVSAENLLALYLGLELQSFSLYILAAIRRNYVRSSEAGLKYFVLGALASGMLLFGITLIYGFTGSIDFHQIGTVLGATGIAPGVIVGMVFILVGLAFKLSAVPFHMWTPDVYEGAPTSVTALLAMVPKIAAIGLLMRLLYGPFGSVAPHWQQIIWIISAGSMIWGGFAGIAQRNIKRLMAYSAIGHMGYALIGVAAGTAGGAGAVLIYITIYMIMTGGIFGIILTMRRNGSAVEEIDDLAGLSRNSPPMAYAMAILMFSMSGIPPLAGFFGKLIIFQAAVEADLYALAVIGVLSSVVAAFYYLKIIKVMFFDEAADPFDRVTTFPMRAVIFLSVLFVTCFIFTPNVLIETSRSAAAALFTG